MFLLSVIARFPLRILYGLSSFLAFVIHRLLRYRLHVVEKNVNLCLPHLSKEQRKRVVRDFYRHLADIAVETVWFGGCSNKERLRKQHMVEILDMQPINDIAAQGSSVMILSSHAGNWELSGGILNYNYTSAPTPFTEQNYVVVYKVLASKYWDKFMRRNRTAPLDDPEGFEGCIETRQVLRYILTHCKEQKFYNFITDQRPYRAAHGSVPVTFLGQSCNSMAAAANIAHRFAFAVVYQRMYRKSRGHYALEYVTITPDASATTPQEIMERYYELLTADIYAHPEQYLWTHKRFK